MTRTSKVLIALAVIAGAAAAQSNFVKPRIAGQVIASQFGQWSSIASGPIISSGSPQTVTLESRTFTLPDSTPFSPLAVGTAIAISGDANPETVIPTSVNCASGGAVCTFAAVFAHVHPSNFMVGSGTDGLQEAINAALTTGGTVVVTPDWTGTTAQITGATGSATVEILDQRQGQYTWYGWTGSVYQAAWGINAPPPGIGSLTATHPSITPTSIEGTVYADQFPGANATAKINAAVTSLGASNGVVVTPPSLAQGALPTSVPGTMTYVAQNGLSTNSPTGEAITSGCPPDSGIANNLLVNLKQCSTNPGTVPQNTLYAEQTVSGSTTGNTQGVNWAGFFAGQIQNPSTTTAFQEEDGIEAEASSLGSGTPPSFKLVSLGAQSWVEDDATDSVTMPYAISVWARAPFIAGSGGTATIQQAWSLEADQPFAGSVDNAAQVLTSMRTQDSLKQEWQTTGTTVWNELVNNGPTHTDDMFLLGAASPGQSASIYLGHGGPEGGSSAPAPLYLNSGGAASVVVNGIGSPANFSAINAGTGGLAVSNGGTSPCPAASIGSIRLCNNSGVDTRNAANNGDVTLIQSNTSNNVWLDPNGDGVVIGSGQTPPALQGVDINSSNQVVSTHLTAPLPVVQGGTGSTSAAVGEGNISTTSGTSDSVTIAWPDGGSRTPGHCALSATNASAATNIATTYISAKSSNAITLTHAATSGMAYDVVCTVN